jgi:predicted lactoylglutathione lyase
VENVRASDGTTIASTRGVKLRVASKERVDELVDKALAVGGLRWNDTNDHGFLHGWSFRDLDGHHWDVFTVDLAVVQERA